MAALLALVVGATRVAVGLLRVGWVNYLMSRTVMTGFLSAAAILIVASQVPAALGSVAPDGNVLARASWSLVHGDSWEVTSVTLSLLTVCVVVVAARLHPLVPGVLVAAVGVLIYSAAAGYGGPIVGASPAGLPALSLDLPWQSLPRWSCPGW